MTDTIRFILNGEVKSVSGLSPTTTILNYLRIEKSLTGTKEGCAEGDCGACTVIVGELKNGTVEQKAVNACILFMPTLDGKQITTIEHLKSNEGTLNPIQETMVSCNGSQCGFCTPGFVMSITAMMHNDKSPCNTKIQDSIAGNLCRCTGYKPILDAATKACKTEDINLPSDIPALESLQRDSLFSYEAGGQKFFAPRTPSELADLLTEHPKATLLAGGTDIGLWVTKHHKHLDTIIYTNAIPELHQIIHTESALEIGAAVSYTDAFDALAAIDETLEELLRRLGSTQIRNSGTIGGNIANGSPIGDGMPPLIALGSKIVLTSKSGSRTLSLDDYFIEYGKQDRKENEFLEKIIVPAQNKDSIFKTYKISKRFDQDISAVCAAFSLDVQDNVITAARIVYGGMAATPKRASKTEEFLEGKEWNDAVAKEAMVFLGKDYTPLTDMRASAEYRDAAAQNLLYRFYLETSAPDTETRVYGYGE
jgi:xanthine dehydrogenase small subunit